MPAFDGLRAAASGVEGLRVQRDDMKTERMPWTCRWSEHRPVKPAPIWMNEWLAQWACLAQEGRPVEQLGQCDQCHRWEPRQGWTEANRAGR